MTIWIIAIAVAIYFFVGGLMAAKYYREDGRHERLFDGIAVAGIVFIFGPAVIVYLATKDTIARFNLWRKNRDTSR